MPYSALAWGKDTLMLAGRELLHISTDRGASRSERPLFENVPTPKKPSVGTFSKTTDPSFFFLVTGGDFEVDDHLYTTDFGNTWIRNTPKYRSRLIRIAASDHKTWFGLVVDSLADRTNFNVFPQFFNYFHPCDGDTLVFTTDAGVTWQAEQQFVGDTITHLVAGDSGRVYMMHFRGGKTFISTYFPQGDPYSVDYIKAKHSTLKVYPNPSTSSVKFTLPVSALLRIRFVNILGQELYATSVNHSADHESTIDYPALLQDWRGPLLMLVEADWFKINQLIIKQ